MSVRLSANTPISGYILHYRLGAGGMAEVWAATHRVLGIPVAIKLLFRGTPAMQERLLREGRVQAAMDHPNILPVRDIVDHNGTPGLVLPFIAGPTLSALLSAYRPSIAEALALFHDIVEGIHHAHQRGLIHRDLKPSNVLLEPRHGRITPRVADFGLVKEVDDVGLTHLGEMMGTLHYAAPEQLRDAASVDHRADLFSLGVILVELLTGQRPFAALSLAGALEAHKAAPDLHAVPEAWKPLCAQLLQTAPEDRLPDSAALLGALEDAPRDRLPLRGPLAQAAQALVAARTPLSATADSRTPPARSRSRDSLASAPAPVARLPAARDSFVGRQEALDTLGSLLQTRRLVNLLGTGGVGKTGMALQFARLHRQEYPGGVFFCNLADVRTLDGIVFAVSHVLDVPLTKADNRRQLVYAIAARGRCLLLLDNFEQLVAYAEDTVGAWLEQAPD
ncbi:MAG: protein kinase, partial [Myxococcota bacterium]